MLGMEESAQQFDTNDFEVKLTRLKDTQESIQGLSAWCLQKKTHHKKIVATWLNVLKNVRVEHRLTLFYLANDVIQHSKRKNYGFVESWGTALQRATTMVRDEKVKHKIMRIFKIWGERTVYNEEFLTDLTGLLSMQPPKMKSKDPNVDPDEFQVQTVVQQIRKCVVLQGETDRSLKSVIKTTLPDVERMSVKDREKVKGLQKEVDEGVRRYDRYMTNLQREIKARQALIATLQEAEEFYTTQRGEVKVVAGAYKNFGNRVKALKKKLDEMAGGLPSPMPSPPANAPSPGPDNDFELPTSSFGFSNGIFSGSYMDSSLPFDPMDFTRKSPSPQGIPVINNSGDTYANTETINDFFKTLIPESYDPGASFSTDYSLSDINLSYAGVPAPSTPLPPYAPITMQTYGMANRSHPPPPPPPAPPQIADTSFGWTDTSTGWNPEEALETPHSPPQYDRKAPANSRPVEYVDMDLPGDQAGTRDVDHRALALDIDHRNLISLTGSPRDQDSNKNLNNNNRNKRSGDDIDLRDGKSAPPLPDSSPKDADFRLSAPPLPAGDADGDLRSLFSNNLPPMLEPPSLGDLEKLLDGDDNSARRRNGQGSETITIDMELSDDEKDVVLIEEKPEEQQHSPLPNIPGFGDYNDHWTPSPNAADAYDQEQQDEYNENANFNASGYHHNHGGGGPPPAPPDQWNTPPPPLMQVRPQFIGGSGGPRWQQQQPQQQQQQAGGLLPTPLMPPRFMSPMGGPQRPYRQNFNNFSPNNFRGGRGGGGGGGGGRGGSPYFRGGGFRGNFNRGRGRW